MKLPFISNKARKEIKILMYHSISNTSADPWAVSLANFESQMKWLKKNNYRVISLNDAVASIKKNKPLKKSVVLTFDDGYEDFFQNALPILDQYSYVASLFIVPGLVGKISAWEPIKIQKKLMNWEQLKKVSKQNHQIGSHSWMHSDLTSLDNEALMYSLQNSKYKLETELSINIGSFSYPWGKFKKREVNALKKHGYTNSVAVGGNACNIETIFTLKRIPVSNQTTMEKFMAAMEHRKCFYLFRAIQ